MKTNAALALIGADPETFVQQGPNITHCINMLGGDKNHPRAVQGGAIQEDNVLFEFNVNPSSDGDEFLKTIQQVMSEGSNILSQYGLRIVRNVSSHIYNPEMMQGFPDKAFEFGCTPDYNAATGEANESPSAENEYLRTAGGHVHIGFSHLCTVTKEEQERIGMMCDYLLGLPSLLEDSDDLRRELYGKAGAIRYKPYGVEYRTLSNYWLWDEGLTKTIHQRAQRAFEMRHCLEELQALIPIADVQQAINTNNREQAKAYLSIIHSVVV